MRFSELARDFTNHLVRRRGRSAGTAETYERCYDQFVAYLVAKGGADANDVREFTPKNVEGFVAWAGEHGKDANTIRNRMSALSSLAKYAMTVETRRGYVLDANPVARVERPRFKEPEERWLTLDQLHMVLAAADERDMLALACVVDQPLRVSEWCNAN